MIEIKLISMNIPVSKKISRNIKSRDWPFNMHIAAFIWILWKNRITGTGDTAGLIDEYF